MPDYGALEIVHKHYKVLGPARLDAKEALYLFGSFGRLEMELLQRSVQDLSLNRYLE